ncbi:hypothetical protein [Nocardioides humi]|uniref:Uncharacterized protein n=1 Tax=Nocardioides humi TaxID=449461 RepID=A0ABN2A0Q8_9ACTN|nr:hypothetical protein [Nocardioides humi]
MNEQLPTTRTPETNISAEQAERERGHEQRHKTLAVRLEEGVHAQLRFIAQLNETSIAEEIRTAIEHRITNAQDDPELLARAHAAREEIEREAAARAAAIAGFMGTQAVAITTATSETTPAANTQAAKVAKATGTPRPRRSTKNTRTSE